MTIFTKRFFGPPDDATNEWKAFGGFINHSVAMAILIPVFGSILEKLALYAGHEYSGYEFALSAITIIAYRYLEKKRTNNTYDYIHDFCVQSFIVAFLFGILGTGIMEKGEVDWRNFVISYFIVLTYLIGCCVGSDASSERSSKIK